MNIGMLWFDNDPKVPIDTKVERAAIYYRNKYGRDPSLCYVHPSMLAQPAGEVQPADDQPPAARLTPGGVELRSNRSVLPNHFWIGQSDPRTEAQS